MKRDVVKATEKLKESEKSFKSIESKIPKNNNSKRSSSKRIENKIAELCLSQFQLGTSPPRATPGD